MNDQELPKPRPLQYASPRDEPQIWTARRILGGVVLVPVGMIVGLMGGAMIVGCLQSSARDMGSFAVGAFVITLSCAAVLALQAYKTKLLTRLFFIGSTIGILIVCLAIGICGSS